MSFLSGLLDGDEYVSANAIEWCNYNNDISSLYELCLWNGIFCCIRKNTLRFCAINHKDLTLLKTKRWNTLPGTQLLRTTKQKAKSTRFKIIGNRCFVRIDSCSNTKELVDMMDIETSTHYFYTVGVKTHNSEYFDMPYIAKRLELLGRGSDKFLRKLNFDYAPDAPQFKEAIQNKVTGQTATVIELVGRVHLDYLLLFKKYEQYGRPSYKLESIGEEVVPELPKLQYEGSLADLYRKDFVYFVRYNLRDTEVLNGFEEKLGYIQLANEMYHMSTAVSKHVFGTIKLSELAVINECHHELGGLIVNDVCRPEIDRQIKGALVLLPQVGEHQYIGSIDIKSLYPSSILTINISPETLRGQFPANEFAFDCISQGTDHELTLALEDGTTEEHTADEWRTILWERKWAISGWGTVFDQSKLGIIPTILDKWFIKRIEYQKLMKQAKEEGDKDKTDYYDRLQYVFKIKLNSFYGALSNLFFRFYDLRMGESTTATGRAIVKHQCRKTAEVIEGNYNVDFPLYESTKEAIGHEAEPGMALNGPLFNGQFQSDSVVYGDSVVGNTKIITQQGEINIADLFTEPEFISSDGKEYCNKINIQALTYDKVSNTTCFKPIKYVMRHKTHKKIYRVYITNSQYVDVTEDHSLIGYVNTRNRSHNKNEILCEVKPTEIGKISNSLVYLQQIPYWNIHTKSLSKEIYELLGYVIGDGYVDNIRTGGTLLSLGSQDLHLICEKLLQPLKDQGWISSWVIKSNKHDVQISSAKLRRFLREHLYSTGIKQTPTWMFNETKENICHFLRGLFSADGWSNKNSDIGITSVKQNDIQDIQKLLFMVGISSTWFTEQTPNRYKGIETRTYSKRLTIKNKKLFCETIGFIQPRKYPCLLKFGRRKLNTDKLDFELVNVHHIEQIQYDDYVYDIEVGDTHMFFANNILVHNTDSTYFETYANNINEAIKIANAVAKKVNNSYTEFVRKVFLCQPGFDHRITCSREVVTGRGIFVDKKRYILHIVDLDGRPPKGDKELKVMGLDTKKTTLPKDVSKKLNKFVERYLKGESWDTVAKDIVDYKDEILTTKNIMTIGLPKGIQGIENYTAAYKLNKETNLPGHVAASIFYNLCREQFNDKKSIEIRSGMKIKVFYLTKTYGRFKSIAIPVDIEEVPAWFFDHFEVNREMHLERLVDNPLSNIIKAIGKKVPTRQSLFVDSVISW